MPDLSAPDGRRPITIVTGASQGIGLELAHCFAKAGNDVMLIARSSGGLGAAAARIAAQHGVRALALTLDVAAPGAIDAIEKELGRQNAYADILVNNAGVGLSGPFAAEDKSALQRLLDLNMTALTALMHHFLPGMIARGRGGILNVASLGGLAPGPYQAAYYASKAYVISLTEAVATEVAAEVTAETTGRGVRVCVLAPGPCRTDFHDKMGASNDFYYRFLPLLSAERAARAGYLGFLWGKRVIIPGVVNNILALALRIMPHALAMPIVAVLLRPRR